MTNERIFLMDGNFSVKQLLSLFIFLLLFTSPVFCQTSLNDLNIIFKHDFENNTLGEYDYGEWQRDWLVPEWSNRQSGNDIVKNTGDLENSTKVMQLNYPANSIGPDEGGTQWWTRFPKQDEAYFSYDVLFMPGFQYALGGKLPGISGGDLATDDGFVRPSGYDGFTAGLMFHKNGELAFYSYFPDSKITRYGETIYWGGGYAPGAFSPSKMVIEYNNENTSVCDPGVWHNITFRVVLNTVKSEGGGNYDGIIEAYFDGKLVIQMSHVLFRHTTDLGIELIRINSFFGGSGDEWRNPIDEWMRIDNVIFYTYKDIVNVPTGNKLSPTDRTINYWRNFNSTNTGVPSMPGYPSLTSQTNSSATIKWSDNSGNENGFKIYRSLEQYENFEEVGSVAANITSFTDNSLHPSTALLLPCKIIQ